MSSPPPPPIPERDPSDPLIGTVLQGRYRIIRPIAVGAMGAVYRAERTQLGRPVAVKFLHVSFAKSPEFVARFEREARVMSRLSHPHCVSVFDFGIAHAPYLVMELVTGRTLYDLLESGRLPIERALRIAHQIQAGLAHAHGNDVIHRDIKPANIMLTEATGTGDHARILDFGLAKLHDGSYASEVSHGAMAVGTPSYMSPEQSLGETVDARTDIYSSGILLFELLTGEKPFQSDEMHETLRMHREAPIPRLGDVVPDESFSDELQAIVDRALAKRPDDRFASAAELAAAIDGVLQQRAHKKARRQIELDDTEWSGRAVREGRSRRWLGWTAAMIVLGLLGGLATAWYLRRAKEPGVATSIGGGSELAAASQSVGQDVGAEVVAVAGPDAAVLVVVDAAVADATPADATPADAAAPDAADDDADDDDDDPPLPDEEQDEPVEALSDDTTVDDAELAAEPVHKPEPPAPKRDASTIAEVKALIADGQREDAISALYRMAKKQPKSAYIPYLLGNLYFAKSWWKDALKNYARAITNNRAYRKKSVLNKNAIRALAGSSTHRQASSLILNKIGRSALSHLRHAAKHDRNPNVRKRAAYLIKRLGKKR
ncbi:MAG TPA: protein kinase [Kofleriaceae bacterium]|nr:protein kinase [Kofleriaceae bacterium]